MDIKDRKDLEKAEEIEDNLKYLIDCLEDTGTKEKQDYLDLGNLKKSLDKVQKDIKEYRKKVDSECDDLKVGNILVISGGDGISYSEKKYINIKKILKDTVLADVATIQIGDYGRLAKTDKDKKLDKKDLIRKYNRSYHRVLTDLKEWYGILEYLEKLPWPEK